MNKQDLVCIVCPMGCRMTIEKDESSQLGYKVTGNTCKRGVTYAVKEVTNPTRVICTTVIIEDFYLKRLPVRTDGEVPKNMIFDCMMEINKTKVKTPINVGDIIVEDLLGTGVNVIASRSAK
ncbi:DUF1667 domain-containing protein [Oceanirhabdus sp. W0125-5]|uniref:DUF1667 domain-containing protein n=1 Tax=Oceanirhabdus sp. W0125-5 TaxID=2999116 RepID=UPI0022F2C7CF|nr:DUF1667 domain-containing protein [Oceanirhabdus sp. W0125-5]WBW99248.1 DUF1667 domain-containing protein [Oceanirhabdus sp. W0125-5]